jgi:hypothetical protein
MSLINHNKFKLMSAVITQNSNNEVKVRMAIIINETEIPQQALIEVKQCVNEFQHMMTTLNIFFSSNANVKPVKSMNISIPTDQDCLVKITSVVRANVFNSLLEWFRYADGVEPNFDVKQIVQPNGLYLTNFAEIVYKTPKISVHTSYRGQKIYKEKFCSIDTCYGPGFEEAFCKYATKRFTSLTGLLTTDIKIPHMYISYYCPIEKTFDTGYEYTVYQFHFYDKMTYYLQLRGNEFVCDYILSTQIGQLNF